MSTSGDDDELKRPRPGRDPEASAPTGEFVPPNEQDAGPSNPIDDWAAKEEAKKEELAAKVDAGRITQPEAVYQTRRFDNENLALENATQTHEQEREEHRQSVEERADEHAQTLVEQANTMRELHTRFETLGENPIDLVEERQLHRSGGRENSGDHYHRALGEQRDDNDPYGSMERAALSEHAAFLQDQQKFEEQISRATSPDERHSLEQRKDIQAADYLASTSHRIADQSEIITGVQANEDATLYRMRAAGYEAESQELRDDYRQRTGQWVAANDVRPEEPAPKPQQQQEGQSQPKPAETSEWSDANIEMTDAKQEKLGRLHERYQEIEARSAARFDQPTRPVGRGQDV